VGVRLSLQYQEWKRLLHHFYDPFPMVEHYEEIFPSRAQQIAAADRAKPRSG
jgi:hypothetical protein